MPTFEQAIDLIQEFNTPYIKVNDAQGKRLFEIQDSDNVGNTVAKLESYKSMLATYGRVHFRAATEVIKKQSYKDAYEWVVIFSGPIATNNNQSQINNMPAMGYISLDHAHLMAEVKGMKDSFELQKQMFELKNQIANSNKPEGIEKYLPMLGMFMDVDPAKMQNMMMFANLQNSMNGNVIPSIAGNFKREENKIELQGTEAEKNVMQSITDQMDKLSDKVQLESIDKFLKALNANPGFITMLTEMADKFQPQK
jgi:hypothetical protein